MNAEWTHRSVIKFYDVLIVGMGAAGMQLALGLSKKKHKVGIISKGDFQQSATYWAQGGIAFPFSDEDSTEDHINDTLQAGAGLCDPEAVNFVVNNSLAAMDELIAMGFPADQSEGKIDRGQEGGHSVRRVIHAGDHTGRSLAETLMQQLNQIKKQNGNGSISFHYNTMAVDLIVQDKRCVGLYALDISEGRVDTYGAKVIVIATGGASWVYQYSTNPQSATGDGLAMAARAGCRLTNMEFCQFHPTCLYNPQVKSFLISETLRGEGAKLLLRSGMSDSVREEIYFMKDFDERAELAPRDIVARAIDSMMKKHGVDHVYLDISHKGADFIKERFPNTYENCIKLGIDITKEAMPVIPAAHYTCGGIYASCEGVTEINNLYALGEAAGTGLHGANRLASNSLLECLVMAQASLKQIDAKLADIPLLEDLPTWDESRVADSDEQVVITQNWSELRESMWNYVGIVRTNKRLERALRRVRMLQEEIKEYYSNYRVSRDFLELRNLVSCAEMIVRAAINRKESRGLHYNTDYPDTLPDAKVSYISLSASEEQPSLSPSPK